MAFLPLFHCEKECLSVPSIRRLFWVVFFLVGSTFSGYVRQETHQPIAKKSHFPDIGKKGPLFHKEPPFLPQTRFEATPLRDIVEARSVARDSMLTSSDSSGDACPRVRERKLLLVDANGHLPWNWDFGRTELWRKTTKLTMLPLIWEGTPHSGLFPVRSREGSSLTGRLWRQHSTSRSDGWERTKITDSSFFHSPKTDP